MSILVLTDTVSGQDLEKYLLQLRVPEFRFFPPVTDLMVLVVKRETKVQRSESQQSGYGSMYLLYHTFGGFHDTQVSFQANST